MRAQFRNRINPTPLAIPNIATARNASITTVTISRTVGSIGAACGSAQSDEQTNQREQNPDHCEDAAKDGDHAGGGYRRRPLLEVFSHKLYS